MLFKVGDKVRIKSSLVIREYYGADSEGSRVYLDESMERYLGKEAEVTHITDDTYSLDIDHGRWIWTDEMFETDDVFTMVSKLVNNEKLRM